MVTFRRLHSGRARTLEKLFLELREWLDLTTDGELGYSITFAVETPGTGTARRFNLHTDATRDAIELFVGLYQRFDGDPALFVSDHARTKPCVRLNSEKPAASGFYNHCTGAGPGPSNTQQARPNGLPAPSRTSGSGIPWRNHSDSSLGRAPRTAPNAAAALDFLRQHAERGAEIDSWEHWLEFRRSSTWRDWVYFAQFGPDIFAWGTASGSGKRLRDSCLFHEKLTGKYDRRVDYLMLKAIHGKPTVWVFEARDALALESRLRDSVGNRFCFGGIDAPDRRTVSLFVFAWFVETSQWKQQSEETRELFAKYLAEIYFAGLSHPDDPSRTFHFGDSLEPGFIDRTLGRAELIQPIEAVLRVRFYDDKQ